MGEPPLLPPSFSGSDAKGARRGTDTLSSTEFRKAGDDGGTPCPSQHGRRLLPVRKVPLEEGQSPGAAQDPYDLPAPEWELNGDEESVTVRATSG